MTEPLIAPVSPTQPVKPLTATSPQKPTTPQSPLEPTQKDEQPVLTPSRASRNDVPANPRRSYPLAPNRAGTFVTGMVLNLNSARIAFVTPQGTPIRGDVSTDLVTGCYSLTPDLVRQLWIFDPGQVRTGLRFSVTLNGSRPFDLQYAETLLLSVVPGLEDAGPLSPESVLKAVVDAVADHELTRYVDAFMLLDNLSDIDLYDVLDKLDAGVIGELLLNFEAVLKTRPEGMSRLLRALESYEYKPERLYIDAFDECYVDPKSFSRDKEREKAGLTNIRLVFIYNLKPARAVIVFADDISDSDRKSPESPRYGEGQLLYPQWTSKGSTPRMWEAKKKKIAEIESQNIEFFTTAYAAVESTINLVMAANGLLIRIIPASTTGALTPYRGLSRPISEAYAKQPGRFEYDFEGGTNMNDEAALYEARVCNRDPGMNYRVNGVRFDGYDHASRTLLDAKYYLDKGGAAKSLARNSYFFGNKVLADGLKQANAARGMTVEWRVAGRVAAGKIEELFRVNNVPIRVVYFP